MAGHTAAYDEFVASFIGGLAYKDDLDLDAYERCTPAEKAELDRLLEQKLPDGDRRVARAIAALWPADKASAVLTAAVGSAPDDPRPVIGRALRQVSETAVVDARRSALFDENADEGARIAAAEALAEIDGAPVNFSLLAALDEPLPGLQRRAAELLFTRRLDGQAAGSTSAAAALRRLLDSDDAEAHAAGVAELKRIAQTGSAQLAGYTAGAAPSAGVAAALARRG